MAWSTFVRLTAVCALVTTSIAQQATVYVYPESCSVEPSTVFPTTTANPTPSVVLENPFFLAVNAASRLARRADVLYLSDNGSLTSDPYKATQFELKTGLLRTIVGYVSTSGLLPFQAFAASPVLSPFSTTFSIGEDNGLWWTNQIFSGGQARFCELDAAINAVFATDIPSGCFLVQLRAVDVDDVWRPAQSSPTTLPGEPGTYIPTFAMTTLGISTRLGCASEVPVPSPSPPNISPGASSVRGTSVVPRTATSTTTTDYPAPTSSGRPLCNNNSPFDGTVNNDYLILCNTALPGSDLAAVSATDFASCIEQCSSFTSRDGQPCVAVTYQASLPSGQQCTLKSNTPPSGIVKGRDSLVDSAILVNVPGAPPIVFITSSSSSYARTSMIASIMTSSDRVIGVSAATSRPTSRPAAASSPFPASTVRPQSSGVVLPTTIVQPQSSAGISPNPPLSSNPTLGQPSAQLTFATFQNTPISPSFVAPVTSNLAATSDAAITSNIAVTSTTPSAVVPPVPSVTSTSPAAQSLCPDLNNQVVNVNGDQYDYQYEILCNDLIAGTPLFANASREDSFQDCISYCTLYNVAIPYKCIGVRFQRQGNSNGLNCYLLSSFVGNTCNTNYDGARLIYGGYPSPVGGACAVPSPSTSTVGPVMSSVQMVTVVTTSGTSVTGPVVLPPVSSNSRPASSSSTMIIPNPQVSVSSSAITTRSTTGPGLGTTSSNPAVQSISSSLSARSTPTTATTSTRPVESSPGSSIRSSSTSTTSAPTPVETRPCPGAPNMTTPDTNGQFYGNECAPGPNQPSTPQCYGYAFQLSDNDKPGFQEGGNKNFEVECRTEFRGNAVGGAYATGYEVDVRGCISACDYLNRLSPNQYPPPCLGVTFYGNETKPQFDQIVQDNCYKWATISCARRSPGFAVNSTDASARLLYEGYPAMVDYNPSFNCAS